MLISADEIQRLTTRIGKLEQQSTGLRTWLYIWTALVALGLILEYRKQFTKLAELLWAYGRQRLPFEWWRVRVILVALAGGAFVTIGVVGELWIEFRQSGVDAELSSDNARLVGDLGQVANDANDKATIVANRADKLTLTLQAEQEKAGILSDRINALFGRVKTQGPRWRLLEEATPSLVKVLTPFAGQNVDVLACGAMATVSGEVRRTFSVLFGTILDEGVKWKVNKHGGDPTPFWSGCSPEMAPGILIFIGSKANKSTRDAATALAAGLRKVLPPSIAKTMPMEIVANSFVAPLGKAHPFNLLVGSPELIVVVVGESPGQ